MTAERRVLGYRPPLQHEVSLLFTGLHPGRLAEQGLF
jgi:hypothetical protein